jgi:hypothetical protein
MFHPLHTALALPPYMGAEHYRESNNMQTEHLPQGTRHWSEGLQHIWNMWFYTCSSMLSIQYVSHNIPHTSSKWTPKCWVELLLQTCTVQILLLTCWVILQSSSLWTKPHNTAHTRVTIYDTVQKFISNKEREWTGLPRGVNIFSRSVFWHSAYLSHPYANLLQISCYTESKINTIHILFKCSSH